MIKANIWEFMEFYTGLLHFQIERQLKALPSDHIGFLQYLYFTGENFSDGSKELKLIREVASNYSIQILTALANWACFVSRSFLIEELITFPDCWTLQPGQ